jgi:hypothetical protein
MKIYSLIIVAIWIAGISGWLANIVKLICLADGGITLMALIRIVGIFVPPLGALLGYF